MRGAKVFGESLRESVYPPQPDPRMTTRSFCSPDEGIASDFSALVASHLCVLCRVIGDVRAERKDRAAGGVRKAWRCRESIALKGRGLRAVLTSILVN